MLGYENVGQKVLKFSRSGCRLDRRPYPLAQTGASLKRAPVKTARSYYGVKEKPEESGCN
jgi:hypothetical protein